MKTKLLTVRISEELEDLITTLANKRQWSKSFLANQILRKFFYELSGDLEG